MNVPDESHLESFNLAKPAYLSRIESQTQTPTLASNNVNNSDPSHRYRDTSSLLEFLYNLAQRHARIIKNDELARNNRCAVAKGHSMEVRRARLDGDGPSQVVALKTPRSELIPLGHKGTSLDRYQSVISDILFEVRVMTHKPLCDHRNIISLIGISFDEHYINNGAFEVFVPILVVPWADFDLESYVQRDQGITYEESKSFVADVADGLEALHLYGLVHADLKPSNILLFPSDNPNSDLLVAKLGDFGFSGSDQDVLEPRGYTPRWSAPEVLLNTRIQPKPSQDVFSFGLLSIFILLGVPSFLRPLTSATDVKSQRSMIGAHIIHFFETQTTLKDERDKWLLLCNEMLVWDAAAREEAAENLGGIRSLLFGHDFYKEEKLQHYRNLVPLRGIKGLPKKYDESWVSFTVDPQVQIHETDVFAKLPQRFQQQLIQEYNAVDWHTLFMGNKMGKAFFSRSTDSLINNFSAIDQLLSIPPNLGNKSEKIWRDLYAATQSIRIMQRHGSVLHQRGLLFTVAFLLMHRPFHVFESYIPERFVPSWGALSNFESRQLNPDLWQLVLKDDLHQIQVVLEKNPKLLRSMHRGTSITHYAALENKPNVLRFLIQLNAEAVNWRDSLQRTPIFFAVLGGNLECVQILIDAGSDLSIRAYAEMRTPLSLAYKAAMPYYGHFPRAAVGSGSDRRKILKLLRDKGDFNNDNSSEYAAWYIRIEYWVIQLRDFIRTLSTYLCLLLVFTPFISLRRLAAMTIVSIFANLAPADYKAACEVLNLVLLFTKSIFWRQVLFVLVIFSCNTVLEATATKIAKTQQKLEVSGRISETSIPVGIIIAKYAPPSKFNSIGAIFFALGIPKSVYYHRNHQRENRYETKKILSLLFWLSAELPWIFCPEWLVGWMLSVLLHHAYGAMDIDRKSAFNESHEACQITEAHSEAVN